eukprot:185093_1
MGNKLSLKRGRSSSVKDEKIMYDIQNRLHDIASNTTSSTRSKSPSDILTRRHSTYDSQQLSYDFDNNIHKSNISLPIKKPSSNTINTTISEKLLCEELAQKYTLNMLLSGNETSGKYTIFKQLEQVFAGSIDDQQTKIALDAIRIMTVRDMVTICNLNLKLQTQNAENVYKIKNSELHQICVRISKLRDISYNLTNELAMTLYLLWNDKSIQLTYKKAMELYILTTSTKYFMNKILQIGDKNYKLTFDDYVEIRCAQKNGVSQKQFLIENKYGKYKFNVHQINKQVSERKRWITYLDNIQIFVYVINIANYEKDSIVETMNIFNNICKESQFENTDFVILFNGINTFENKLKTIPFSCFDVDNPNDSKCIQESIANQLTKIFKINNIYNENTKRRSIYFHKVDEKNMPQIGLLLQQIHTDVITTSMKRMGYVF